MYLIPRISRDFFLTSEGAHLGEAEAPRMSLKKLPLRLKLLLSLLVLAILGSVFFSLPVGRWTARWLFARTGKRTVPSVLRKLRPKMRRRFGKKLAMWTNGKPLALLAFKHERRLEVWKKRVGGWKKIRSYPFTAFSGKIGPKLRQGDMQIPEGIYKLTFLHPNSQFYLSMKINYPNAFDRQKARGDGRDELGGDIFIHGDAVTIGCVPIGDEGIEEVFYLVAKNGGYWRNTVIFAPYDMRKKSKPPIQTPSITWLPNLYQRISRALRPFQP
ncbi:MAG: hypothetical protein H6727_02325 [Myxococcales bacterium]|nr:hypothetical protein [Myxococcales bacterium]